MSWVKRLGGRLPDFEEVVRRFPIAVSVMAIATIWLIFQIHFDDFVDGQEYTFGGFILAGYGAVVGKLIAEANSWPFWKSAILPTLLAGTAFLVSKFGKELGFLIPLAIGGAILFLGNSAAWRRSRHDASVWNFTQKLWTGAIFAAVGSVIFAAGMFIISEAVKALFGVNLEDLTIKTLLPIGLLFLAPVYWMGTLPRYGEAEDVAELSFEARALSFLGTWMLAPLVTIYALIILAYGVKVLVQWELPKGEIALLVSPFLGVGMLVWLMLEPKVLKEGAFVRFYRAVWHWIMLPAAILLGIAVFVRIREYGFTPIRFFLITVVIWAFVQSLWFTARSKLKRDIRIPTALAAGLMMIGAFAAAPLSANSQFQRAKASKVKLSNFSPEAIRDNPEAAKAFLGAMSYLIRHDHEKQFKRLLPEQKFPNRSYGDDFDTLVEGLGLRGVADEVQARYSSFDLTAQSPILFSEEGRLYVGPNLKLFSSSQVTNGKGILLSQEGFSVVLSVEGEVFNVDLSDKFSGLKPAGEREVDRNLEVPAISIMSESGVLATLHILGGEINYRGDELSGGYITFAVVLSR